MACLNFDLFLLFFLIISSKTYFALASRGNNAPIFEECLANCQNKYNCPVENSAFGWSREKCF